MGPSVLGGSLLLFALFALCSLLVDHKNHCYRVQTPQYETQRRTQTLLSLKANLI